LILTLVSTGYASGYYYPDLGVTSLSRGGANVAGVNDLTALWYNPAALTRIRALQIDLDVTGVHQAASFLRASETGVDAEGQSVVTNYEKVENTAPVFPVPAVGIAHNFGLDDFTFALGFYTPLAPPIHTFDEAGAQRYNLVSNQMIQASYGPAVGWSVNDWLSVGLGVTGSILSVKQDMDVHMFIPELAGFEIAQFGDPAGDVGFAIEAKDNFLLSANAGVLIEPKDSFWALGFSIRPPVQYEAQGTIVADFSNHYLYAPNDPAKKIIMDESADSDMTLTVNMPLIIKSGLLVRPAENLEIEASFVWEGWSSNEALVVEGVEFLVDTSIQPVEVVTDVELPAGFQDAWSVRLGGTYTLNDTLSLSGGGLYEVSAVPSSSLGLGQIDMDKFGYGLGVSWALSKQVELNASFGQLFFQTAEVSDSEVEAVMVNAISGEVTEDGAIVGNGVYTSDVLLGGLGLSWAFGQ